MPFRTETEIKVTDYWFSIYFNTIFSPYTGYLNTEMWKYMGPDTKSCFRIPACILDLAISFVIN